MNRTLIALGLVGALGAAGCSSNDTRSGAASRTRAAATATTTRPIFVANTKNTPGTLKNFVGAHADVHDTKCVDAETGWTATGKVTNPTEQKVQYRIFVSFLAGDTTAGIAQTDVLANPNATADWTATVGAPGKDLRCILRVERAAT